MCFLVASRGVCGGGKGGFARAPQVQFLGVEAETCQASKAQIWGFPKLAVSALTAVMLIVDQSSFSAACFQFKSQLRALESPSPSSLTEIVTA